MILAIIGSPRKGNSYQATKEAEKYIGKVEYLFLKDYKLDTCKGCFNCLKLGIDNCPLKDDSKKIYVRMKKASAVIFVSPTYVMTVSGLFKNFIDRFSSLCHRPEFFSIPMMLISTTGAIGHKDTLKYMEYALSSWGFGPATKLGLKTPPMRGMKMDKEKIRKKALEFKKKMKRKYRPSFNQIVQFRVQRRIFLTRQAKRDLPKDYRHYSKLRDKNFPIKVKTNPIYDAVGELIGLVVSAFMK